MPAAARSSVGERLCASNGLLPKARSRSSLLIASPAHATAAIEAMIPENALIVDCSASGRWLYLELEISRTTNEAPVARVA